MNIDDLTIGEVKQLTRMIGIENKDTLNSQLGEQVIVRTYSAGVWYGKLIEKAGTEVILEDARRLYKWKTNKGISLSGISQNGINHNESRICIRTSRQWLDAIEIISMSQGAIQSLEEAADCEN